ncbi:MAG TPA: hypothetical protein VLJ68_06890 [Chitinophagaceae bacterium]|nr:hypothetical protein [Chitinophagaceae bacterium]
MSISAVITGDIVNSTLLVSPAIEKKLITQLSAVLKEHKFEFYRGDSFQAYIRNPDEALELVFQLRAIARSFSFIHDVRASIGIGKAATPVRNLRTATSEAFILSGRSFDRLGDEIRLSIESPDPEANTAFRVIASYADFISKRLTSKQAEVVSELLKEHTQTETAKKLKKAQATVNKHAQAAGWSEIEKLIYEYKQVIHQLISS